MTFAELLNETLGEQQTVASESSETALLIDGLIMLYHMSAHKQLGKVRTCLFVIVFIQQFKRLVKIYICCLWHIVAF